MYKLLYIIRKSEFMDNNLLQCDTPVAVLLLVASSIAGYRPSIGPVDQNAQLEKYYVYRSIFLWQFFAVIWIVK